MEDADILVPPLRQDLQLQKATKDHNHENEWLLYDPLNHAYHVVNEQTFVLLHFWSEGETNAILQKANTRSDHHFNLEDINTTVNFLYQHGLADAPRNGDTNSLIEAHHNKKKASGKKLIHSYVFFRISLLKPQRILDRFSPLAAPFFDKKFWIVLSCLAVLAIALVARQWDQFLTTFFGFLSVEGFIGYALAIIFTKMAHEFGHAFAAHRYGCRVTSMGVGFMLMFPLLYADTTDAWRLKSRQKKLVIGAAGMGAELIIAVFATLLWNLIPDGSLRSICFFLATTSWVLTIFVNLNPLMRFDGYYLLADFLNIKNLQPRSNALGLWWLREQLFAPQDPCPEHLPMKMHYSIIFYAFCVWIYRFFLFMGIALLLHAFIIKAIAIILAGVEIGWFIVRPILMEIKNWPHLIKRGTMKNNLFSASILAIAVMVVFVPWQSSIKAPAVVEPSLEQTLFAKLPGKIEKILITHGQSVQKNDPLLVLHSPALETQMQLTRQTISLLQARVNRQTVDREDRAQNNVLISQLASERERLKGFQKLKEDMILKAPFDGVIHGIIPGLHKGRWINSAQGLMEIQGEAATMTTAYVSEDDIARLENGAAAKFYADDPLQKRIGLKLQNIAPAGTSILDKPILASTYGGGIAVRENEYGESEPVRGMFRVLLSGSAEVDRDIRGIVHIKGERRSIASHVWRRIVAIYNRETGA